MGLGSIQWTFAHSGGPHARILGWPISRAEGFAIADDEGITRVPVLGFLPGQVVAGRGGLSSTKLAVFWQTVGHVRQMDFGVLGVYRWVVSKGDVTH